MEESSALGVEDLKEVQQDLLSASSSKAPTDSKGDGDLSMGGQGTSFDATNDVTSAIVIDGKTLGVDDVIEMKKKIDDLMLINESRDKKISEVGITKKSFFEGMLELNLTQQLFKILNINSSWPKKTAMIRRLMLFCLKLHRNIWEKMM